MCGVSVFMLNSVCAVIENYRCVWGECLHAEFCVCAVIDNYRCVWGECLHAEFCVCRDR